MIESVNHAFIDPSIRTPVDNILLCSGGGIAATFFTLGAIEQLLDNNKFLNTFDIISSTSGSVIPLLLVELHYVYFLIISPRSNAIWKTEHALK